VMGLLTFGVRLLLETVVTSGGIVTYGAVVIGSGGVGLLTFALLATWLGLDEWRGLIVLLSRRLRG